ncbi:ESX secretion-associated protein EspG [Mycobacterium talmoniae]|uniref:ESX secretion-associated protein EspG n=1 Tax=Mycobacterium talmoniae TaxID=1858794 RepID=A0A1S1MZ18_9MYCO|nr:MULTISPECIES: ESX secretion-associated protein EspG [Mycobacterium]OHU92280.1 ESX secretion-associated protein EspG [Mycobacterium talmoniae]PQM44845.1 ESX-1 secretion-associated protein EspG1 [Mycobacterium talmoniae]TDH46454.1 ESX secretion-associated protein EspG [Mycobacterium eburneum]
MTTAAPPQYTVTDDELQAIAARIGIQSFPVVLGIRPRHGTVEMLTAALDHATGTLVSRGLITDGEVSAELVPLLQALQRPDRELAMRLVTPEGIARLALVRRGRLAVLARRVGNEIALRVIEGDGGLDTVTRALLAELPRAEAAQVTPVGAPLETMSQNLSGTHDPAQLADRIRALGAEPRAAMLLGSALASRAAFAEIVYYALSADADRISRRPAAVGVFYTKRGRIVGAPSASPSGQLWSTLKPGSDHAIGQAIGQLVELSDGGWGCF